MSISKSKSKAIIDWFGAGNRCSAFWVGKETLPQVEEYLDACSRVREKIEREIDKQIGVACAVMRTLHRSAVVKRELKQKAKLSIYQ